MSYAGMAAQVVGGELQGWAAVLEKWKMQKEYENEIARQAGYRKEGQAISDRAISQSGSAAAQQDLAAGQAQRQQAYSNALQVPMSTQAGPTTSRDEAWANMRGQARSALGSYSDWALNQTLRNISNQEALRQVSNFAGGTAGVFPYRMYSAQHSMDDLAMIGAAISSLGGGAANYAQFASAPQSTGMQPQNQWGNNSWLQGMSNENLAGMWGAQQAAGAGAAGGAAGLVF